MFKAAFFFIGIGLGAAVYACPDGSACQEAKEMVSQLKFAFANKSAAPDYYDYLVNRAVYFLTTGKILDDKDKSYGITTDQQRKFLEGEKHYYDEIIRFASEAPGKIDWALINTNVTRDPVAQAHAQAVRGQIPGSSEPTGGEAEQVFARTLSGNTIIVDVLTTDTIGQLKGKIARQSGISPEDQRLIYAGNELGEEGKISDYGNDLRMNLISRRVAPAGSARVAGVLHIQSPLDKIFTVHDVFAGDKVNLVKEKIQLRTGIPVLRQRLQWDDKDLADDRILADYGGAAVLNEGRKLKLLIKK